MITLANQATPKPLTLAQQNEAMTSEGAAPSGQMPKAAPPAPVPPVVSARTTLHLHAAATGKPAQDPA